MSIYPKAVEPNRESLAPKHSIMEEHDHAPTPNSDAAASATQSLQTVQLQDVLPPHVARLAEAHSRASSLERILLAPVGSAESASQIPDEVTALPALHPPKISAQAQAAKLKDESASDDKITDAIVAALAGAGVAEMGKNCSLFPGLEARIVSHGQSSPGSSVAGQDDARFSQQKQAREVLKTLQQLGYTLQKDPSHSPKTQNPGSAASNKSDNLVTCQTCKRFTGRPCELKYISPNVIASCLTRSRKHMKRHSRPYGCTFLTCRKTFGSKNDWKRHENSQHFHLETWRCDEEKVGGDACAKVCYRRQSFQDHLKKDHDVLDAEVLKSKVDACRIGRNCQARFWCGFCIKLVDLTNKGVEAWTERFDHIDDHFMGRHGLAMQSIRDWIPVDGGKPRGEVDSPMDPSSGKDCSSQDDSSSPSGSPPGDSPEALEPTGDGESPKNAINLDAARKRRRSSGDTDSRAAKHTKTSQQIDKVTFCV